MVLSGWFFLFLTGIFCLMTKRLPGLDPLCPPAPQRERGASQASSRRRGFLRRAVAQIAGRILLGLALLGLAINFADFDSFGVPSQAELRSASAAVIFTGAFERVDAGFQLLAAGVVTRLYISGANAGAGIHPTRFVHMFSLRNPKVANLQGLVECCVEWGERAENTFQNACETKCWIQRRGLTGPLLLITSKEHMARALAVLSGALPRRALIPYPVNDALPPGNRSRERAIEYFKHLATVVALRLPGLKTWRDGPFATTCPLPP